MLKRTSLDCYVKGRFVRECQRFDKTLAEVQAALRVRATRSPGRGGRDAHPHARLVDHETDAAGVPRRHPGDAVLASPMSGQFDGKTE